MACSEAEVSPKSITPTKRDFDSGVLCGTYVIAVDGGYFKHREQARGQTRKMKALEKAREGARSGG